VALLTLLPFSYAELKKTQYVPKTIEESMFKGFYPRLYDDDLKPREWFPNYIQTYVERDVRQIKGVEDLPTFQKFIKLCAARSGQILNIQSLATDCGISPNTAKGWLNVLEVSYIVFILQPHYKNFNKRLIKSPKLYFWDTGLASYLLGIQREEDLLVHSQRGALFENWVVSELHKSAYSKGNRPSLYFWADKAHEVDVVFENGNDLIPVEIKSADTIQNHLFRSLEYWCDLAHADPTQGYLIYAGDKNLDYQKARIRSWKKLPEF
jgi:hypothetical protein